MNWKIQVVAIAEDGSQSTREIHSIQREDLKPETLGLTLAEGKAILKEHPADRSPTVSLQRVGTAPAWPRLWQSAHQQELP